MGRYARSCPIPKPTGGGGKGGKPGPKGGGKGGPKGGGKAGKGPRSQQICPTCGKTGHGKERCWDTYPHLKKKKVQAVAEEETVEMNGICIAALDACVVCDCCPVGVVCDRCPVGNNYDNDIMEPAWTTITSKVFAQSTAASSGALLGTRGILPRVSTRYNALQGEGEDIEEEEKNTRCCSEKYAGDYAGDVGASGFASDEELYAEKARKQQ